MSYPVKCKKCNNPIYGPVKYCPFCGAVFVSVTAPAEKQDIDVLRSEINSTLTQGEYTPDFRQFINKKGKNMGISEESSDILLLEVLKEKRFITERENPHDPLSECWYSAEKKKNIAKTEQKPETIKEEPPKEEKREEVKQPVSKPPEPPEIPVPPPPPPKEDKSGVGTPEPEDLLPPPPPLPPPKPLFLKVVAAIIVLSIGYFVYTNFLGTSHFLGKIDRALNEKRYFSPSGNSVADFYRAKKAESPNSPELRDAVSRIKQKLEPEGDAAFQQLYAESNDSDWDNTVNIYKLLNEIMPDDRDIAAKAEFCQAHQIIKGKMKKNGSFVKKLK